MSSDVERLPPDPGLLRVVIVALQAESAGMSAPLRAHDQLIQTLRLRIAKLGKQAFGTSSEKIEREIAQLELALEDLPIAAAEGETRPVDEVAAEEDAPATFINSTDMPKPRRRPRGADTTRREWRELDPGNDCPDCGGDLRLAPKARMFKHAPLVR